MTSPDSLPDPGDSLAAGEWRRWDDTPSGSQAGRSGRHPLLTRPTLFASSALTLSDALLRGSDLGVHRAGAHGAWDLPYRLGPGVDRLSLWRDGMPTSGSGLPEGNLHTLSPLSLERVRRVGPSPYLDPLGWSTDGMIWAEEAPADPVVVSSAVRLCEGAGGVGTQEMWLTRLAGRWRLSGSYAHSRGEGRPVWVQPRYTGTQYQNLVADLDRSVGSGVVRLSVAGRDGKWTMEGRRKLVWESIQYAAGWQSGDHGATHLEVRFLRHNDLLRWWHAPGDSRRRTTSTALVGRGALALGALRIRFATGVERVDAALRMRDEYDRSWAANGLGVATGVQWEDSLSSMEAAVGYCDPWWGEPHLRAHLGAARRLAPALRASLEGWRNESVPFVPRLEGDGEALLSEGLLLPGWIEASEAPPRRRDHAELLLGLGEGRRTLRAGLFADRLENGLGLNPAVAEQLAPAPRDTLDYRQLLGEATLGGLTCAGRVGLWWGAALAGDATLILAPREAELPLLTPRYRGRGVFSLGGRIFKGDLAWEGRMIYIARSGWLTPHGASDAQGRLDAEIHATIGSAHIFLALRNVENAEQISATYADDAWAPLMLRSYQAGFEWHFRD